MSMFFLFSYFCCISKQVQWVDGFGLGENFDKIKNIDNRHDHIGYCIADPTYKNTPLALIKM